MKNKTTLRLRDLYDTIASDIGHATPMTMSVSNVDDVFLVLKKRGIREVVVNFGEMHMITMFTINAIQQHNDEQDRNWDALKLIQEGEMDKFFGVKLILEK